MSTNTTTTRKEGGEEEEEEEEKDKSARENLTSKIEDDDEPDDWDKRIFSTGCATEQTKMNDCYFDKKDWRACKNEMEAFRECWKRKGNDRRVETKDV